MLRILELRIVLRPSAVRHKFRFYTEFTKKYSEKFFKSVPILRSELTVFNVGARTWRARQVMWKSEYFVYVKI